MSIHKVSQKSDALAGIRTPRQLNNSFEPQEMNPLSSIVGNSPGMGTLSATLLNNGGVVSAFGQSTNAAGNLVFGGGVLQGTGNADLTAGARVRNALSQKDLADRLGVIQPTISNWENGTATPRKKQLGKLIDVFDIALETGHEPFGQWGRQTGKAKGLSVRKLAGKAKINTHVVYHIENGTTATPHPKTVRAPKGRLTFRVPLAAVDSCRRLGIHCSRYLAS